MCHCKAVRGHSVLFEVSVLWMHVFVNEFPTLQPFDGECSRNVKSDPSGCRGWTPEGAKQLRSLFQKALQHGLEPVEALGGLPHEDDFELVGAMSDASKRQLDPQYPISSKMNRKTTSSEPDGSKSTKGCYVTKAMAGPYPSQLEPEAESHVLPPLPPGVVSTAQWSKTKINFGKFKSRNWTYLDLLQSKEEEAMSYVKWRKARTQSAGDDLKDLCSFMYRFELENSHGRLRTGELIPGTENRRVFK